jgi:copper(I)-binding protein
MGRLALAITAASLAASLGLAGQQQDAAAVSAWIASPPAGQDWAAAYVEIENPTMYDLNIVSAEAAGAGRVELRGPAGDGAEPPVVKYFSVPAYGGNAAGPEAPHLRLLELQRPLRAGDTVELTLRTDSSVELAVQAEVRAP